MKTTRLLLAFALIAIPSLALGAGLAHSENFIVVGPEDAQAEEVLARAEQLRGELAREWLDAELPPGVGRTIINVRISETENRAFTWPIDCPQRKFHKVWLTGSEERLPALMGHEIVHVVLRTRYGDRLPKFFEEGIASLEDDARRAETRRGILRWYADTGQWPRLAAALGAEAISPDDQSAYTLAASVTEYLLARGDKQTLLAFALDGKETGFDRALREHYGIGSVDELETAWRAWAKRRPGQYAAAGRTAEARLPIDP
jgi:hypothetical protein